MTRYAIVNSTTTEVVEIRNEDSSYDPGVGFFKIESDEAEVGWFYDIGTFPYLQPRLSTSSQESYAFQLYQTKQVEGIVVSGVTYAVTPNALAILASVYPKAAGIEGDDELIFRLSPSFTTLSFTAEEFLETYDILMSYAQQLEIAYESVFDNATNDTYPTYHSMNTAFPLEIAASVPDFTPLPDIREALDGKQDHSTTLDELSELDVSEHIKEMLETESRSATRAHLELDTAALHPEEYFALANHTHTAGQISDSTSVGRSVLTAANAAAARSAIGAGQSNVSLPITIADTTGLQTALDGKASTSHTHNASDINAGTLADGRVAQSNVTQHQAALTIAASQVTGTKISAFISDFTEAAQDAVGAALSAEFVYNDAGNSIGLRAPSFATPSRSLVSSASATGFQISSTRDAFVAYEGKMNTVTQALVLSAGASEVEVLLETANTNSTTPSDWTVVARQNSSQNIALGVAITSTDGEPWSLCRRIPAGKYVRIRTNVVTGSGATFSINAEQQEVLL